MTEAYRFTLVRDRSPAEPTSRLEGRPEAPLRGMDAVVNAVGTFLRTEDQVLRLCFDPMPPENRWGAEPGELLGSDSASRWRIRNRTSPRGWRSPRQNT
ncbi:hypothetical protein ACFY40_17895 [Streptomyces sp. NPDC012950]|uniref:hypothetical protein n=1 Tax=Streptomyces sp. NPDC012950 TaxID=3364858 RepID=UPI00369F565F